MDLAGIEPASESLFIEASPITVAVYIPLDVRPPTGLQP